MKESVRLRKTIRCAWQTGSYHHARRGVFSELRARNTQKGGERKTPRIGLVLADAEFDSERNPTTTRGTECDPRQAWKENLANPWSARRDAAAVPATDLSSSRSGREPVQFGEAQTLFPCTRSLAAHTKAEALLLGLSFNVYRLRHRYRFLGCQQSQVIS